MLKLLLTLAIVVFALMWWFGKGRDKTPPAKGGKSGKGAGRAAGSPAVRMVECAHCGLHLPLGDALEGEGGRYFCGAEHRRLGPGAPR